VLDQERAFGQILAQQGVEAAIIVAQEQDGLEIGFGGTQEIQPFVHCLADRPFVRSDDPSRWVLEADERGEAKSTSTSRLENLVGVEGLGPILLKDTGLQPLLVCPVSTFIGVTVVRRERTGEPGEVAWVLSQASSAGIVNLVVWWCSKAAAIGEPIGVADTLECKETHG
jgi:hypothetical protein